jgi:hypothetical protein
MINCKRCSIIIKGKKKGLLGNGTRPLEEKRASPARGRNKRKEKVADSPVDCSSVNEGNEATFCFVFAFIGRANRCGAWGETTNSHSGLIIKNSSYRIMPSIAKGL